MLSQVDPRRQSALQLQWTRPFTEPEEFSLQHSHEPFRVGITFQVVATRERLHDSKRRAGLHEGDRRRQAPIVAHQRPPLTLDTRQALSLNRLLQQEPVSALGFNPDNVTDNLLVYQDRTRTR